VVAGRCFFPEFRRIQIAGLPAYQYYGSMVSSSKHSKLTFDLSDTPELVELLRVEAVRTKTSQKGIVVNALKAYFAEKLDSEMLLRMAEASFKEWESEADKAYDNL
jgi:hypothetical protein